MNTFATRLIALIKGYMNSCNWAVGVKNWKPVFKKDRCNIWTVY